MQCFSINAAKGAVKKYTAPHPPNASQPSTSFSSNSNSSNEKMTNMERSTNRTYCDITDPSRSSDINYSQNLRDNDESDRKVSNKFTFTPMTPDELAARLNKNNVREMTNNQQTTSYNNDIYPDHHYESIDYSHWSPPTRNTVPVQSAPPIDRFSDIKNELRVLRRELKDVCIFFTLYYLIFSHCELFKLNF